MENTNEEFEDRFPELKVVLESIRQLEELDLTNIPEEDLVKKIDDCFPMIPINTAKIPEGTVLFRARINKGQEMYKKVSEISMPGEELIKEYGRANKPEEQIFYCASNFKLAAFEVLQDYKNLVNPKHQVAFLTIGVWKVMEELHVASVIHSHVLHELREDITNALKEHKKIMNSGKLNGETIQSSELISQFFSDQFTKKNIVTDSDYRISAFYAGRVNQANDLIAERFKSSRFDGVNYPSVAMKYKGDNQAVFKSSFENKIQIVDALQITASNFDFENGDFKAGILHNSSSIEEGEITWNDKIYEPSMRKF